MILNNGFDINNITNILFDKTNQYNNSKFSDRIYQIIVDEKLYIPSIFQDYYQYYKNIVFLYDYELDHILASKIMEKQNKVPNLHIQNATFDFYEGFGC